MRRLSFQFQIQAIVAVLVLAAVLLSSGTIFMMVRREVVEFGSAMSQTIAQHLRGAIAAYVETTRGRLHAGADASQSLIDPSQVAPGYDNTFLIVDRIRFQYDLLASIYVHTANGFQCISTNRGSEHGGKRPLGDTLRGLVAESLAKGRPFEGEEVIDGVLRLVEYRPLFWEGRVVGALLVGKRVLSAELEKLLETTSIQGKGYPFIIDNRGMFVFHPRKEMQGKPAAESLPMAGQLQSAPEGVISYQWNGESHIAAKAVAQSIGWNIFFSMTAQETLHGLDAMVLRAAALGLAGALVVAILTVFGLVPRLLLPVRRMAEAARSIASGNYNVHIDYAAKDAIGQTAEAIHAMAVTIKERMGFAQGVLESIQSPSIICDPNAKVLRCNQAVLDLLEIGGKPEDWIGQDVNRLVYGNNSQDTIAAQVARDRQARLGVERVLPTRRGGQVHVRIDCTPLYDLDGRYLGSSSIWADLTDILRAKESIEQAQKRLLNVAAQVESLTQHIASASDELAAQIEQVSRGTEVQRERTSAAASAMEEMNATVLEVAKHAAEAVRGSQEVLTKSTEGGQSVERVIHSMDAVRQRSGALAGEIDALGKQAESIGSIVEVIADIADQTNLLALNAAIEAARAGDAGRGFAVVADEVRKLAERTMAATSQVTESISAITQTIAANVHSMDQVKNSVETTSQLASRAGEVLTAIGRIAEISMSQITSIATAAEEQSATSEEITRSVAEISSIANEAAEAMAQSAQAVGDLARQVGILRELVEALRK
jgi:methyl-accepting chemotaxis protein